MLTETERQKLRRAGYSDEKIKAFETRHFKTDPYVTPEHIRKLQEESVRKNPFSSEGVIGRAADNVVDFLGGRAVADTFGSELAKMGSSSQEERDIISSEQPGVRETVGGGLMLGSSLVPGAGATAGAAKLALAGAAGGYLYDIGQRLSEGEADPGEAGTYAPGMGTLVGGIAAPAIPAGIGAVVRSTRGLQRGLQTGITSGVRQVSEAGAEGVGRIRGKVSEVLSDNELAKGVVQTGKEILERVPRFAGRVRDDLTDAALRSERLERSPLPLQNAIRSGLDDWFVDSVTQADNATRKAYREVVNIAESASVPGQRKQPTIVGGNLATEQYDLIDKQRKNVGTKIGEAVDKLSRDMQVDMADSYNVLDDLLFSQGVTVTDKGKLSFRGRFTPSERTRIQELYDLAREGGGSMTPRQIYDMDQLFSKLQRETRMEGIGDIIIDLPDGNKTSLFRAFRDVFTNKLDEVSPDDIRTLNRQYRNLSTLVEDIENSIFKTPNFEITKSTDPAEFAKVNLRRIFGEAQSSPVYEAIADEMDAISRQLGYKGAVPKQVAEFAQAIRTIYPNSVPKTGFAGGIRSGMMDIANQVLSAGKADVRDKQKALRELLEALDSQSFNAGATPSQLGQNTMPEVTGTRNSLIEEAKKYKSAKEFIKSQNTPQSVSVWMKSKFSEKGAYVDMPVVRKEENITLYQGGAGEGRQFWTPSKKYAEQFGDVIEKTGTFYQIDNGNRVTDVYVEAPSRTQLEEIWRQVK